MKLPPVASPGDLIVLTHHDVLRVEEVGGVLLGNVVLGPERLFLGALVVFVAVLVIVVVIVVIIIVVVIVIIVLLRPFA